ncbi:putative membrane protein [Methanohalophilus levihalophilus]|uniref:DUF63 family protein n=1 Tax=Methanohalophilus levihalophilus TaxID=1431282 RepID=UPI001AE6E7A7|nr:DUF63 family protein [Methanohalophilus levihalophilus]MBP2029179.1 putative membrane protein [Methanohalophilus levihalophilus]
MGELTDQLVQFINRYYIDPVIYDSGYNPVNTITWGLILGICVFGVVKLLQKMDVKIDDRFIYSVIPFVFAGSSLRVLEDAGIFSAPLSYLFITPNIYFVVFIVTTICLIFSKKLFDFGKIRNWHRLFSGIGLLWFLCNLVTLLYFEDIQRPDAFLAIVLFGSGLAFLIYYISTKAKFSIITDRVNFTILWVHLLDASSTFVGVDFLGYYEKHVVPAYLIDLTGTALVMFPLKLAIFLPVIYILDSQFKDEESISLTTFVKMVIIVLGLSPACRNTLRMTLGI